MGNSRQCVLIKGNTYQVAFIPEKYAKQNFHPTVKPVKLIEYLVKLITPKNGITMDIYNGSGTFMRACEKLQIKYIACEIQKEYCDIAVGRLKADMQYELY